MCVCVCAHRFVLRMEELYVYIVVFRHSYVSALFVF